ncbi:MAG TPA: methyltransferase [Candidatus Sulfotelmatobacter sp.]|nr:methyltransferase [Candidatus Sulfotelmatobacter sp.]
METKMEKKYESLMNSSEKHTKEMGCEGAGPKIMLPMFVTVIITAIVSYIYWPLFSYPMMSMGTLPFGALLLVIGVPSWFLTVKTFARAFSSGQLATHGPYAIMPNPIYGIFMSLVIPGISLVLNSWLILFTSVLGFVALRIFIHEEVNTLWKKFGTEYDEYRKRVLIKFL